MQSCDRFFIFLFIFTAGCNPFDTAFSRYNFPDSLLGRDSAHALILEPVPDGDIAMTEKTIDLKNSARMNAPSLGRISLRVPAAWDTTYSWHDASDCSCCGENNIRIQSSKDEIKKERGWIHPGNYMVNFGITIIYTPCPIVYSSKDTVSPVVRYAEKFLDKNMEMLRFKNKLLENQMVASQYHTFHYTQTHNEEEYVSDTVGGSQEWKYTPITYGRLTASIYRNPCVVTLTSSFYLKDSIYYRECFRRILPTVQVRTK